MSRLSEIKIRVESSIPPAPMESDDAGLGRGSHAILVELATLLDRLANSDLTGTIDLHSMPMSDVDRNNLQESLGRGEVRAFFDAEGMSEVQETAIPGIWWIQHRDKDGALIAELLEVASVPAILARANDEIMHGVVLLKDRIELSQPNRVAAPRYGR